MSESIEITITPEGDLKGELRGIEGAGCEKLLDWLAELGTTTVDRRTPDYYRRQTVERRQSAGGRI
jgi:hypothetical protein